MTNNRCFGIILGICLSGLGCGDTSTVLSAESCTGEACPDNDTEQGDVSSDSEIDIEAGDAERSADARENTGESTDSNIEDDSDGVNEGNEEDASEAAESDVESSEGDVENDLDGPQIELISPDLAEANIAVPFAVQITFNEPIREETVDKNTFQIKNLVGKNIGGTPELSADGTTVTMIPLEAKQDWASTYTVEVSGFVQDVLGNLMGEDFQSEFYTGAPDNLGNFENLIDQYTPIIRQGISTLNTQFDYPLAVNFDEDWEASNNRKSIKSLTEVTPSFYWDAVESQSHVFLYYMLFHPLKLSDKKEPVGNDMTGFIVTLKKETELELAPVSVTAYSSPDVSAGIEKVRVFAVEGAELGKGNFIDQTAPWAELTTDDHFEAWMTQGLHVTCSWVFGKEGECELNSGILETLSWMIFEYGDGKADTLSNSNGWPAEGNWKMEKRHLLPSLWARRGSQGEGGLWQDTYEFDYSPILDANTGKQRPGNDLTALPSFFDKVDDDHKPGRPPWAWKWEPGGAFTDLPRGTLYLDPAFFFRKRHGMEQFDWVPEENTGWSTTYCYHGALGIDDRTTLDGCLPVE